MLMALLIGTSGWQYRSWRESFYPDGLPQARWLEHYAARFQTLEVNNAFYRLPEARTFADWARRTPDDFVVAVKMSRYLTHVRRLREPAEPVQLFLSRARQLGSKLGPVLVQLPPTLRADTRALGATLGCFPSAVRVAVELRHESWFADETAELLADHGAALCLADGPRLRTPLWRTADWGYLRLHEGRATPKPCYGRAALSGWARRLAEIWGPDADAFAFFNNDERCCAVRDATVLARTAPRSGLRPTRVPKTSEVRVS
jgi:uncharacterized protein YecE (DUF72 family)